jgi:hypothetical protein
MKSQAEKAHRAALIIFAVLSTAGLFGQTALADAWRSAAVFGNHSSMLSATTYLSSASGGPSFLRANAEAKAKPTPQAPDSSAKPQNPPAKDSGMVWVNTETGVYHRPGSRWYGKTKKGKYMLESDAIKAGYKPAKPEK